jgi:cysteine desulfurase
MRVYLDWNATTPPHPDVLSAMQAAPWGNPASIHADGRAARAVVEDAREAVAALAGADARDVVLTSGGTEANNLALRSAFAESGGAIVASRIEHPSITKIADALEREGRAKARWLRVGEDGLVDLAHLEELLAAGDVRLVSVMAVNHETGAIQPLEDVYRLAHAKNARVHVDAVQAWSKIEVPAGWDSIAFGAHKMRGPKGIGALATRPGTKVLPVLLGGSQEKGIRPGTVDASLAAGLGASAKRAKVNPVQHARIAPLRDRLEAGLRALGADPVASSSPRAAHVTLCRWPGWIGAELVAALDLEGVSVSSGAACSAGTVEPSPVLLAMLGDARREEATSGVRCSLGDLTTSADIEFALAAFARVAQRGAANSA